MNPIQTFETAISSVLRSATPGKAKAGQLRLVQDGIKRYISRAEPQVEKIADSTERRKGMRAIQYLKNLAKDCEMKATTCTKGKPV